MKKIAVKPSPALERAVEDRFLIETRELSLSYGSAQALKNISVKMRERYVTAFIGPSGCGKSTLLRCFNRMNDLIDNVKVTGPNQNWRTGD